MLDWQWTVTALITQPDIPYYVSAYKKQLKKYFSFEFNAGDYTALEIFDKIVTASERAERLSTLGNAIGAAYGLLSEKNKGVIKEFYFERKSREQVAEELGISASLFKSRKRAAVLKMAFYLEMFGFTDKRFLEYFNDEPAIVEALARVLRSLKTAERFGFKEKEIEKRQAN